MFVIAALLIIVTLVFAVESLVRSGSSTAALIMAMVWPLIGPHLVLASILVVALLILLLTRRGTEPVLFVAAVLGVVALVWSSIITFSIVGATAGDDKPVNPVAALIPVAPLGEPDETSTYTTTDGQNMQVLVYKPATNTGSAAPILYYIHGGGWIGGTAAQEGPSLHQYADAEWLVVNVDYTLATAERPTWDQAPAEVACRLSWTAANADRLGGDTTRITVMGDSAGGNLAVVLGWSAAANQATSACPDQGPVPVPAAVIGAYPVINPEYSYEYGANFFTQTPKGFTDDYLGGTPSEYPERLASISPMTYATANAPRTLIIEPERDDFIPAQGVYDMVEQAQSAGLDVTLVKVPFAHHSFDFVPGILGNAAKQNIVTDYLRESGLAPTD